MYFNNFDFESFWGDALSADSLSLTDNVINSVEKELGYKLPLSYIEFMKIHNGGVPAKNCFPTNTPTGWADDHIAISDFLSVGFDDDSLCGRFGSQFWIDEWEYPDIGVAICNCPSAGHDMVFLDYRRCGISGKPAVVHIDQENDYRITSLAPNFEEFVKGLVSEENFE